MQRMPQKQIDDVESDATRHIEATNFLLSSVRVCTYFVGSTDLGWIGFIINIVLLGMLCIMQVAKKQIVYRAIEKTDELLDSQEERPCQGRGACSQL